MLRRISPWSLTLWVLAALLLGSCFAFVLLITWTANRAMVWRERTR